MFSVLPLGLCSFLMGLKVPPPLAQPSLDIIDVFDPLSVCHSSNIQMQQGEKINYFLKICLELSLQRQAGESIYL
jgi:hypothetical protein